MDKQDKPGRAGQNAAFYTALAVCLIAVGVGTWQLLRPEGAAPDAQSGTAAVLPDAARVPTLNASEEEAAQAVSGAADVARDASGADAGEEQAASGGADADAATGANAGISDTKAAEAGNAASSKDAGNAKAATSSKDTGNTKAATSSKDAGNAKNATSSKDTGNTKSASGAKSGKNADAGKSSGGAVRPVEGETVTAYSMDKLLYNETMRDWRTHDGIDIAADEGTAVVAAKAGTVSSVAADPVMGMTVTVRHEGAWETVYSSLTDAPEVEAGDEVTAGQVIGFVGQTAASESALGPHLHFSVLNGGVPSDPEAFLS